MAVKKKFTNKKNALGRGLDAIEGGRGLDALIDTTGVKTQGSSTINEVALDQIDANPNQPRREFDETALQELAESIRQIGIIQPITLRQMADGRYQIIAGERRWRASQLAGLATVPAYIRTINDENVMEMALVENIQREDLNAIDIALAYSQLLEQEGMTQEKVADRVGKSRVAVANYLRLLKLSTDAQIAVRDNQISMAHARAMVPVEDEQLQRKLVSQIVNEALSVRQTEALVKKMLADSGAPKTKVKITLSDEVRNFQSELSKKLKTKVNIKKDISGKGSLTIPFASDAELKRIISLLQ